MKKAFSFILITLLVLAVGFFIYKRKADGNDEENVVETDVAQKDVPLLENITILPNARQQDSAIDAGEDEEDPLNEVENTSDDEEPVIIENKLRRFTGRITIKR